MLFAFFSFKLSSRPYLTFIHYGRHHIRCRAYGWPDRRYERLPSKHSSGRRYDAPHLLTCYIADRYTVSVDVPVPVVPSASPMPVTSISLANASTTAVPLLDLSSTISISPATVSLPDVVFPGVTLAPILPIVEQIGNVALSSIASDLASILSIFSSAAAAINTTMPPVTMPAVCSTTVSSFTATLPTAVDGGNGSLLSSLAAQTTGSASASTAVLTATGAAWTISVPSLISSSMSPIVTSIDVNVPININPNVSLSRIRETMLTIANVRHLYRSTSPPS